MQEVITVLINKWYVVGVELNIAELSTIRREASAREMYMYVGEFISIHVHAHTYVAILPVSPDTGSDLQFLQSIINH